MKNCGEIKGIKEKNKSLYNYVENLKFSTRLSVVNAIRKRSEQKNLSNDNYNLR